jgi:O-antigen/teichoic acid export membrane protein
MEELEAEGPTARRSIGLSSTGVFLVSLAIQLLGYIPTHFFAQHVGLDDSGLGVLGTIQWFMLLASSINMIGDLRIGSAYTFFIARGESPLNATGTYFVLRVAMVAAGGVLLWFSAPAFDPKYNTEQFLGPFALWMLLPVLWSVSTVYSQLWVAQGRSVRGQVPLLIESISRTGALTIIAVWSLGLPVASFPDIVAPVTYAYVFGASVSAVYSFPSVWRATRAARTAVAARLFRFAWPLMGSLILLFLSTTLVQFFVIGHYGPALFTVFLAGNGLRILVLSIPAAVAVPLFPHLSRLHKERDYEVIRQRTWAALRYTALAAVPLVMAMVVYRVNLLNILYSGPYATEGGGAVALAILAISAVPAALSQIIGTSLNSVGLQRLELYLTALQISVLVVGCLLFMVPLNLFGLPGPVAGSLAVLVSSVAALLLNTYFMERLLGVRIQARPIGSIVVGAAGAFLVVGQFNNYLGSVGRYYQLLAGVILGFVAYAFVLAAIGELSKADVRQIVGAIGLPPAFATILARLCWREETWPVNPAPEGGAVGLRPLDPKLERGENADAKPPLRGA